MNIKKLLIEKERISYIRGDTNSAEFFDACLQYIIYLEEKVNKADAKKEQEAEDGTNTRA